MRRLATMGRRYLINLGIYSKQVIVVLLENKLNVYADSDSKRLEFDFQTTFSSQYYLHDLVLRAATTFWYGPVDILLGHFDTTALAMYTILCIDN